MDGAKDTEQARAPEPDWITYEELQALKAEPEREPVKPMINGVMPKSSPPQREPT